MQFSENPALFLDLRLLPKDLWLAVFSKKPSIVASFRFAMRLRFCALAETSGDGFEESDIHPHLNDVYAKSGKSTAPLETSVSFGMPGFSGLWLQDGIRNLGIRALPTTPLGRFHFPGPGAFGCFLVDG